MSDKALKYLHIRKIKVNGSDQWSNSIQDNSTNAMFEHFTGGSISITEKGLADLEFVATLHGWCIIKDE